MLVRPGQNTSWAFLIIFRSSSPPPRPISRATKSGIVILQTNFLRRSSRSQPRFALYRGVAGDETRFPVPDTDLSLTVGVFLRFAQRFRVFSRTGPSILLNRILPVRPSPTPSLSLSHLVTVVLDTCSFFPFLTLLTE